MATNSDHQSLWLQARYQLAVGLSRQVMDEMSFHVATPDGTMHATYCAENTEPGMTNSGVTVLVMTSTHQVPAGWLKLLQGIEGGQWPGAFVPHKPNDFLFDHYPRSMQSFCTDATESLQREALRVFGLTRWRLNNAAWRGARRLGAVRHLWSRDGERWLRLRLRPVVTATLAPQGLILEPAGATAVEELAQSSTADEPLGREIWHSAFSAGDQRTSVILAVSAVEVEVKRLIRDLVAHSEWLVMNTASPPIRRIIKDYLPTLPGIDPSMLPPKHLLATLQRAVELRNQFVHVGDADGGRWVGGAPNRDEVAEILDATSDLLWLFDIYRGHTWAAQHLANRTRSQVGDGLVPELRESKDETAIRPTTDPLR